MGNDGFTLIELLAVIIILAIVAIISTPIILNVVNDARMSAAEAKAWGTIEAVDSKYKQDTLSGVVGVGEYNVDFTESGNSKNVKIRGIGPTGGAVKVSADGLVTCKDLTFDNYKCSSSNGTGMTCTKQ